MAILVPITTGEGRRSSESFKVDMPNDSQICGCIVADQIKNLDWRVRNAQYHSEIPKFATNDVLERVLVLLTPKR